MSQTALGRPNTLTQKGVVTCSQDDSGVSLRCKFNVWIYDSRGSADALGERGTTETRPVAVVSSDRQKRLLPSLSWKMI